MTRIEAAATVEISAIEVEGVTVDVIGHAWIDTDGTSKTHLWAVVETGTYELRPAYREAGEGGTAQGSQVKRKGTDSYLHAIADSRKDAKAALSNARRILRDRALVAQHGSAALAVVRTFTVDEFAALDQTTPLQVGDVVGIHGHGRHRQGVVVALGTTRVRYLFATPSGMTPTLGDDRPGNVRLVRRPGAAPAPAAEAEPFTIDGVAACGADMGDGKRCGRGPDHGDDHPHIVDPAAPTGDEQDAQARAGVVRAQLDRAEAATLASSGPAPLPAATPMDDAEVAAWLDTVEIMTLPEVERSRGAVRNPDKFAQLDTTARARLAARPAPADGPVYGVILHGNVAVVGPFATTGEADAWWGAEFNRLAGLARWVLVPAVRCARHDNGHEAHGHAAVAGECALVQPCPRVTHAHLAATSPECLEPDDDTDPAEDLAATAELADALAAGPSVTVDTSAATAALAALAAAMPTEDLPRRPTGDAPAEPLTVEHVAALARTQGGEVLAQAGAEVLLYVDGVQTGAVTYPTAAAAGAAVDRVRATGQTPAAGFADEVTRLGVVLAAVTVAAHDDDELGPLARRWARLSPDARRATLHRADELVRERWALNTASAWRHALDQVPPFPTGARVFIAAGAEDLGTDEPRVGVVQRSWMSDQGWRFAVATGGGADRATWPVRAEDLGLVRETESIRCGCCAALMEPYVGGILRPVTGGRRPALRHQCSPALTATCGVCGVDPEAVGAGEALHHPGCEARHAMNRADRRGDELLARHSRQGAALSVGPSDSARADRLWFDAGSLDDAEQALAANGYTRVSPWGYGWGSDDRNDAVTAFVRPTAPPAPPLNPLAVSGRLRQLRQLGIEWQPADDPYLAALVERGRAVQVATCAPSGRACWRYLPDGDEVAVGDLVTVASSSPVAHSWGKVHQVHRLDGSTDVQAWIVCPDRPTRGYWVPVGMLTVAHRPTYHLADLVRNVVPESAAHGSVGLVARFGDTLGAGAEPIVWVVYANGPDAGRERCGPVSAFELDTPTFPPTIGMVQPPQPGDELWPDAGGGDLAERLGSAIDAQVRAAATVIIHP